MRALALLLGAICGIAWWAVSVLLGAKAYGIVGTHSETGAFSGAFTGIAVTALSIPVYRLASPGPLLWYSPLSVYVAVALYGLIVFVIRWLMKDFDVGQIPWAVGVQSIVGMWWGITFLALIAIPVH